jgi:hypothetical protein
LTAAGTHLLGARAYDTSGNAAAALPVAITIAGAQATCATPGVSCVPGGGAARTDCFAEWLVVGDVAVPHPSRKDNVVSCVDGAACDRDGKADGVCTFDVGICFSVADARLVDASGLPACQPGDLTQFEFLPDLKHRRRRQTPAAAANTAAVLSAVAALSGARSTGICVSGLLDAACSTSSDCDSAAATADGDCEPQQIALSAAPSGERCTAIQAVQVPLRQRGATLRRASQAFKAATTAAAVPGSRTTPRDTDSLRLVCLPPPY